MGFLDYFGLTGNSGLVPGGHIGATYSAGRGNVFVEVEDFWQRVKKSEVTPGMNIVKCRLCDKPAVSLDHYYPYDIQFNRCEDHIDD